MGCIRACQDHNPVRVVGKGHGHIRRHPVGRHFSVPATGLILVAHPCCALSRCLGGLVPACLRLSFSGGTCSCSAPYAADPGWPRCSAGLCDPHRACPATEVWPTLPLWSLVGVLVRLRDAFPQSSWLLSPSPYLLVFPGTRSRFRRLGLRRVSEGGCPGPRWGGRAAWGCVRVQAGSLLPFPRAWGRGSLRARGAARPGDTARPLRSNGGGGRGVTGGTGPRGAREGGQPQ